MSPPCYKVSDTDQLAERIVKLHSHKHARVVIGIFGVPGSGKTTISHRLCERLNQIGLRSSILSQDGFHLSREQLRQMPDPQTAIARRGSPYTFDAPSFLATVQKLTAPAFAGSTVWAPSFDHAVKDPVENDVCIEPDVQAVVVEGNYLGLKDPVWSDIKPSLDEIWFLDTPLTVAEQRLVKRHMDSGIVASEQDALARANDNDLPNGRYILSNSFEPDVVLQ